jgi:hypothetical protein
MIMPNEPTTGMSKKGKIVYYGIIIVVSALILVAVGNVVITSMLSVNDFWAPGSGTEVSGAPDNTYLQKDWGSFNNETRMWDFAICDHDYLGPLHGSWKVAEGVWVPTWKAGVYPTDAQLYVTVKDNIIVDTHVSSQWSYGSR